MESKKIKKIVDYHNYRIKVIKKVIPYYKKQLKYDELTKCSHELEFHSAALTLIKAVK